MADETPIVDLVPIPKDEKPPDKETQTQEIYFNGIEVGMSLSDFQITLVTNGRRHSRLLLSFTTAKTLLATLGFAMGEFEKRTRQTIMVMDDVKRAIEEKKDNAQQSHES